MLLLTNKILNICFNIPPLCLQMTIASCLIGIYNNYSYVNIYHSNGDRNRCAAYTHCDAKTFYDSIGAERFTSVSVNTNIVKTLSTSMHIIRMLFKYVIFHCQFKYFFVCAESALQNSLMFYSDGVSANAER